MEPPPRRAPLVPLAFVAWTVAVIAGMALRWIEPPAIGYEVGPERVMVPLALLFFGVGGGLVAGLAFLARLPRGVSALAAGTAALSSAVFGLVCGYGCFSAVWST